ncbi:hypothetical protein HPP92_006210 [Vanilla planifolia]|uniref:Uncharacterized protein n=1 Tax=Vanilla planifolia TaxID=51239 RepID=A0A835RN59_VANPL|nr:hypothetical protein HPP92_006210 [Vanilla planifolia]
MGQNLTNKKIQPTGKGPMSPMRRARAISSAMRRQEEIQPSSTVQTRFTMYAAKVHGIAIRIPFSTAQPRKKQPRLKYD